MIKTILTASAAAMLFVNCGESGATKTEAAKDTTTAATTATITSGVSLTDQEKNDGWELLFDGVSTKGWHKFNGSTVGSAWKIIDGALYLEGDKTKRVANDGGDIVTDQEYSNFHLKYDWKIDTGGNSGLIFYSKEDSTKYKYPWQTGPEMQVLDNERHADAKIPKHRAGDLYDLIACSTETAKPAAVWNSAEIISKDGKLEFILNGTSVVKTTLWDDNWKKLVAGSKFASMKDFGTFKSGRFALQDHGDGVWFRNIKIQKL